MRELVRPVVSSFTAMSVVPQAARFFVVLLALAAAMATAPPAFAACPNFSAPVPYTAGTGTYGVAVGDFNGDARKDFVIANRDTNNVSVFLGNGNGTFSAATNYAVGTFPLNVTVTELNGDGREDLVVANLSGGTLSILLGNGNGTFATATSVTVGTDPTMTAAADFNGDGKRDLIVANSGSGDLSLLLGNGNGTFAASTVSSSFGFGFQAVATGDFNGDGKIDFVAGDRIARDVFTFLGSGTGTFAETPLPAQLSGISGAQQIVPVDFTGDGKLDLIVAAVSHIDRLEGTGTGVFNPTSSITATNARSLAVADFGNLGQLQVASAGSGGVRVSGSAFGSGTTEAVAAADFNGDGLQDIVATRGNGGFVLLGTYCPPIISSISPAYGPTTGGTVVTINGTDFTPGVTTVKFGSVAATGVTCTSLQCTAIAPPGQGTVRVTATTGTFTSPDVAFDEFTYVAVPATACAVFGAPASLTAGTTPSGVAVRDLNGDGRADLVVANGGANTVSVFLGTGNGSFGSGTSHVTGAQPRAVAVADLNADGFLDLVVAIDGIENDEVVILAGAGNGTFGTATPLFSTFGPPAALLIDDINADGRSDVVVLANGSIDGWRHTTTGYVRAYSAGPILTAIALGDVDGNGGAEVLATTETNNVNIYQFGGLVGSAPTGSTPVAIASADFNGDGKMDVVTADAGASTLSVLLSTSGPGAPSLGTATPYTVGATPNAVTTGDVNGDGRADIVVASSVGLQLLIGNGNGTFAAPVTLTSSSGLTKPVLFDVSGDNRADVISVSPTANSVNVALNITSTGSFVFSSATSSVAEGTATATITVTRTGGSDCNASVQYATSAGTAAAGVDYTTTSGTLTFAGGETSKTFTVPVINDSTYEAGETFNVTLSAPAGASLGATATQTVTIVDNDPAPVLSIAGNTKVEGTGATSNLQLTVTLTGPTSVPATVSYATANGTATAPADYAVTSGTLTFPVGVTTQIISVPVVGDTTDEFDETFTVTLSNPAAATIGTGTATGVIQNDDIPPTIAIADTSLFETLSGTAPMNFTVTLSQISGKPITVNYATANGTATAGADYTNTTGTATINPGQLTQTIAIPIIGDLLLTEPDETLIVALSAPVNVTIARSAATGTILNNPGIADVGVTIATSSTVGYVTHPLTYTFTVTNHGPDPAVSVVLTDVLPAGVTFVSSASSQGTCSGTTTVTCNLGRMEANGSATISLVVTPNATTSALVNNVSVSAAPQPDPNPANNSRSNSIMVLAAAAIPTLGEWAQILLAVMLAGTAFVAIRRVG